MPLLFERLQQAADDWRGGGYACAAHPMIGEILAFQHEAQEDRAALKFLREPQFRALEVYWYVRLVRNTPHIMDLYRHFFQHDKQAFSDALGTGLTKDTLVFAGIDDIIQKIREDEYFARTKKFRALHEAATLAYPSYILALAMGAGKTVLIGAIIATEFAMALHYPRSAFAFMKNALVFAPGTTIMQSLRELSEIPYEKILPPDLHRAFLANLKIEFPGRGKDIQTQRGGSYNLIVTNTEKISLRAKPPRKNQQQEAIARDAVEANLRLQTIASLPGLGVFSDEAHHTYGNVFDKLKRVRETINYIHAHTPVVAVINTTGTPYYKKQPLKEVIVWYGLGDGIRDNILKDLNNGIHQYDIGARSEREVFADIIAEFFKTYGKAALPDGAKAKIAFYFKTQEHLDRSRRYIEQALLAAGGNATQILVNTQKSAAKEVDEFNRLNNPGNQKRVILLIGKGTEGWNCPSLFACALIKEQTSSNNYVLQAATRCLRQVPGNRHSAKIFLDVANAIILDKELQNNFGTDLDRLSAKMRERETVTLRIIKTELPTLEITRTVKRAVRADAPGKNITLTKPKAQNASNTVRSILTPDFSGPREILLPTGDTTELPPAKAITGCHAAAWKIASRYHLPAMPLLEKLRAIYPAGEMPDADLHGLFLQVEAQQADYETVEVKSASARREKLQPDRFRHHVVHAAGAAPRVEDVHSIMARANAD
ncbi:MAG: DEAD/DEAH box helicase family protein [Gammaproteobacteria bacterium]